MTGQRGGSRPGAGRPRKMVPVDLNEPATPLEFYRRLMANDDADPALRLRAAEALERLEAEEQRRANPLGLIVA